jgi:hypothetical protein
MDTAVDKTQVKESSIHKDSRKHSKEGSDNRELLCTEVPQEATKQD